MVWFECPFQSGALTPPLGLLSKTVQQMMTYNRYLRGEKHSKIAYEILGF